EAFGRWPGRRGRVADGIRRRVAPIPGAQARGAGQQHAARQESTPLTTENAPPPFANRATSG
ncbi:MAG: hypothetical protein KGL25_13770, partial [Gammaproteobacteria bacterium]|nr:hypothetical protein [Gammaproteobacteria bacterium]